MIDVYVHKLEQILIILWEIYVLLYVILWETLIHKFYTFMKHGDRIMNVVCIITSMWLHYYVIVQYKSSIRFITDFQQYLILMYR